SSSFLTNVRELVLSGNGLDDEQLRALARSPSFKKLECLSLFENRITDAGVEVITATWPGLTELELGSNAVGSPGARAIASRMERLEMLGLGSNHIFLEGMTALAEAPALASLKKLQLKGNPGGPLVAEIFAASPHIAKDAIDLDANIPLNDDAVLEELEKS